ncbi:MAG: hypothetical protein K0B37_11070 [Bacteroidales bacterium]|nr:hypothetical protein [Bacteroidales bacterium]
MRLYLELTGFIFLMFFTNISVFSQPDTIQNVRTARLQNPASATMKKHSVYVGSGYGNDLLYAGTSLTASQPFISADLTYAFLGKFWTSATLYNLPGRQPAIPFYDLSAGFSHVFNDYLDISASVSSYINTGKTDDELYGSFAYLRLSGGFDWVWVYSKLTAGRILEQDSGIYVYLRNSRYFRTGTFGKSDNYFSFDPNVNILFGNLYQVQPLYRGQNRPDGRNGQRGQGQNQIIGEEITNQFTLLQTEISVPVSFYFHNFTFEAEPLYLFPRSLNGESSGAKGFYFFLNAYYRIF